MRHHRTSRVLAILYILTGLLLNRYTLAPLSADGSLDGILANVVVLALQCTLVARGIAALGGWYPLRLREVIRHGAVAVVTLVSAEVVVRSYAFGLAGFSVARMATFRTMGDSGLVRASVHPEIVYELKPNLDRFHKLTVFITNSEGLRDRAYDAEKPDGTVRVAAIGDSFTMGEGVPISKVYHSVLEDRFNARPGPRYEFLNFGVGGYSLRQYVGVVREKVRGIEADLILVGYTPHNDFHLPPDEIFETPYTERPERPASFLVWYTLEFMRFAAETLRGDPATTGPGFTAEQTAYLDTMFGRLGDLGKEYDVPVLVAQLGTHLAMPSPRAMVERHGIHYVDAGAALVGRPPRDLSTFPPFDGHPNALANQAYADAIMAYMLDRNLPDEGGGRP